MTERTVQWCDVRRWVERASWWLIAVLAGLTVAIAVWVWAVDRRPPRDTTPAPPVDRLVERLRELPVIGWVLDWVNEPEWVGRMQPDRIDADTWETTETGL